MASDAVHDRLVGELPDIPFGTCRPFCAIMGNPDRVAGLYFVTEYILDEGCSGIYYRFSAVMAFHFTEPLECFLVQFLLGTSLMNGLDVEYRRKVFIAQVSYRLYEMSGLLKWIFG